MGPVTYKASIQRLFEISEQEASCSFFQTNKVDAVASQGLSSAVNTSGQTSNNLVVTVVNTAGGMPSDESTTSQFSAPLTFDESRQGKTSQPFKLGQQKKPGLHRKRSSQDLGDASVVEPDPIRAKMAESDPSLDVPMTADELEYANQVFGKKKKKLCKKPQENQPEKDTVALTNPPPQTVEDAAQCANTSDCRFPDYVGFPRLDKDRPVEGLPRSEVSYQPTRYAQYYWGAKNNSNHPDHTVIEYITKVLPSLHLFKHEKS